VANIFRNAKAQRTPDRFNENLQKEKKEIGVKANSLSQQGAKNNAVR
jgi:hypothetical protein